MNANCKNKSAKFQGCSYSMQNSLGILARNPDTRRHGCIWAGSECVHKNRSGLKKFGSGNSLEHHWKFFPKKKAWIHWYVNCLSVAIIINIVELQGHVHSETVIPLISQAKGASKAGMLPFGAYRRNVSNVIDNHDFDTSKVQFSEAYDAVTWHFLSSRSIKTFSKMIMRIDGSGTQQFCRRPQYSMLRPFSALKEVEKVLLLGPKLFQAGSNTSPGNW